MENFEKKEVVGVRLSNWETGLGRAVSVDIYIKGGCDWDLDRREKVR